ncbi:hypothetical protein PROFUN_07687 [Planoprotostelium fungivorum]|uniref:Radial spoke head protein 9 homolog n=1 Tax=Planoprotostelium fungivorum TaxID=1890364 RepID=A0A2P6MM63_9EUKA|nr:hypothetical protein PROFUN_07687 [Planoprotostelium fungivorum]
MLEIHHNSKLSKCGLHCAKLKSENALKIHQVLGHRQSRRFATMNSEDFTSKLSYAGSSGYTLNVEERASLQTSLPILKRNLKFSRVNFWGKVFGINRDYLIAQGFGSDHFGQRKSFCSHDGIDWVQLPELDSESIRLTEAIRGRLTGDPSTESFLEISLDGKIRLEEQKTPSSEANEKVVSENEDEEDEENSQKPPESDKKSNKTVIINEEKRLAYLISQIDKDTSVVPRGAFTIGSQHEVRENHSFHGLTVAQSTELAYYFHLRQPEKLPRKTLLEREGHVKIIDFADNIAEDVPHVTNVVTIRSLLWPGYFAFAVSNSPVYGSVYFGFGEKNDDIGFLL